ncbi:hypothetical protein Caci_2884 [Catenulispora acidiphila DSM 44928]|uniref:Uncharacterized protein n=1 Tax=Catenulispora acidiphila (strain DSM 44928 / JCM 14897 / NBRC 102108 / NRRL B-24433 / ID139908) TaxID=479433 RepID=C7Q2Q1_CATAD|nr:hypothetical protein [Catenulispora acidiphila]ACU71793.1 hypothetical protein Caci_2884 [Catenulispora acidiphila DSM 44928]
MTYPLRFPNDDPRFSTALLDEINSVLINHGYPWVDDDDTSYADLRAALAGFLYGPAFNAGDKVSWVFDGNVRTGRVDIVANTPEGPVARIITDPQPGHRHLATVTTVKACRELTPIPGGDR